MANYAALLRFFIEANLLFFNNIHYRRILFDFVARYLCLLSNVLTAIW